MGSREILAPSIDGGRLLSEELVTERRLEFLGELDHATSSPAVMRDLETNGFAIQEELLSAELAQRLIDSLNRIDRIAAVRQRGGVFAVRNLLEVCPEIRSLAESKLLRHYLAPILGDSYIPVRGILFDKIADANWNVSFHQDVTIAVRERIEQEGF